MHEHTLNVEIAKILHGLRRHWRVIGQPMRILERNLYPDILVCQEKHPAVLIENEYMPASNVETEGRERLGLKITNGDTVHTVIVLRSPAALRTKNTHKNIVESKFDYALLTGKSPKCAKRFPKSGWLNGSLYDLAGFIHRSAVPAEWLEDLADSVQRGIHEAAKKIEGLSVDRQKKIEKTLQQEYNEQTCRMAMVILLNALIFHESFSGNKGIHNIAKTRGKSIRKQNFLNEWKKILKINYRPIFGVAHSILIDIPEKFAQDILGRLIETSADISSKLIFSHDIFGRVFQKLIADRKFLATFYTRPASAVLLANLAIPSDQPFEGGSWKSNVDEYITADFACGTGTLLSAAYQRISELHEQHGGDMKESHVNMMEKSLTGCDVMPAAVHLTTSILSGMQPTQPFEDTKLYVMPYGEPKKNEYRIGSLELLVNTSFLPVISSSAEKSSGTGNVKSHVREILSDHFRLIIMNPPFTRPTNRAGKLREDMVNPAFASFGADNELQGKLGARNKELRKDTCGNGNAGLASDFVALADKKVALNGTTAFVLPLSAMAGYSWKKVRAMWTEHYYDICVISLAAANARDCSFSADTNMAEILFIGKKMSEQKFKTSDRERRGTFITLNKRPENEIEATEFARIINCTLKKGISKLEDDPKGGTSIFAGSSKIGGMLDAPLQPPGDHWGVSRIRDLTLAQIAYALVGGRLRLPRQSKDKAINIKMCELQKIAQKGYISRDINGTYKGKKRGPFNIVPLVESENVPTYPCLWASDCKRETQIEIAPDNEGRVRDGMMDRAIEIWQTASRAHHNVDFGFGAQPLAVAMTEKPTIGGRAWANVFGFKNSSQEEAYALWSNSTLGLLLYWWYSNKPQGCRGTISPARLPSMPTLDLTALSKEQLAEAKRGFNSIKNKKLLPFYLANKDATRLKLDKIILVDVLGLSKETLNEIEIVRDKLCLEPSVRGGKK